MRLKRSGRRPSRLALLAPQGDGRHQSFSRRVRARALPTTTKNSHPLAKNRGEAERRKAHPTIVRASQTSLRSLRKPICARKRAKIGACSPSGAPLRHSPAQSQPPLAQLQNHVSWDAAGAGVLPASGLSSPASSSQTGPFTRQAVPRSRPGADCKSAAGTALAPLSGLPSGKAPSMSKVRGMVTYSVTVVKDLVAELETFGRRVE
jgi:hypothetical protein